MYISESQWATYDRDGYLLVPNYFSEQEVQLMRNQLRKILNEDEPQRILEDSGVVRSVYGVHTKGGIFERLVRHPRLLEPAMQLLKSEVYVYQSKVNAKAAMGGDLWEWHQDFIFWHKEDGLPSARIINMSVFLDEVTEFNGPLMLVPGSHKVGVVDSESRSTPDVDNGEDRWKMNVTAALKYSLSREVVAEAVKMNGIVAPKGPAGSLLLFSPTIFHASSNNMSPFHRNILIVTYNSIENLPQPVKAPRPEFLAARDHTAVVPLSEDFSL